MVDYKTDLLQEVKEKDAHQAVPKLSVLETTHTLYPEPDRMHMYTDGSVTDKNRNAGAGIRCKLLSFYLTLGTTCQSLRWRARSTECCINASF
jgi:hypothetical protein